MASRQALTLSQAADRLGVRTQRINQMLSKGVLTGPDVGPGRAPKGALRVWESSLRHEEERRRRSAAPGDGRKRQSRNVSKSPSQGARTSASFLVEKIRLDSLREALREERQANKRLTQLLADAVAEIQAAQAQADRLDDIADGYSDALTQLATPDDASGVP